MKPFRPFSSKPLIALAVCAGLWVSGCRVSDSPTTRACYLDFQVDDSLFAFDSVFIDLQDPATHSVRKTVWHGPLRSAEPLKHIASGDYCGDSVDISVTAAQTDSSRPYRRLVHYYGAAGKTVTEVLPPIPAPVVVPKDSVVAPKDTAGASKDTVQLYTTKDAPIDTTVRYNNGLSGAFPLPTQTGSPKLFVFKFDLTAIKAAQLKSGKLHFNIYVGGSNPISGSVPILCRIYGIHSDWVEGTGNWYYHRKDWQNNGDILFGSYPMLDSIKSRSTDPKDTTGIDSSDKEQLRLSAATLLTSESVPLTLPRVRVANILPVIPARGDLSDLSIDMTSFLKTAVPDQDFGWMITVDGLPENIALGSLSREFGDGTLGPRLTLTY